MARLEELYRRSVENGVPGAELIGPERLRELEPHVAGVRALHSPETGVVDFGRVVEAYADDVRAGGGEILLGREVAGLSRRGGTTTVATKQGAVDAERVVVCGGVHADRLATLSGAPPEPRIVPFRGDYLVLRPERRHLVRGLVYPVPDPAFPFLGIHTTVRPDGEVWLGPNAVLALAREGYRRRDVSLRDLRETMRSRGFRRLARRHWRMGGGEMVRDLSTRLFVASTRKLLPGLEVSDVLPGPSGIRAQALAADGTSSTTSCSTRRRASSTCAMRPHPARPRRSRSQASSRTASRHAVPTDLGSHVPSGRGYVPGTDLTLERGRGDVGTACSRGRGTRTLASTAMPPRGRGYVPGRARF